MTDEIPETIATYFRLRKLPVPHGYRKNRKNRSSDDENVPYTRGRDPKTLRDVIERFTTASGWEDQLADENVLLNWELVIGSETAQHAKAVSLIDGVLTVQCDSTAWAKQLQFMRAEILTKVKLHHEKTRIDSVRILGPDVPSWKHGPRTVSGRGPRDTYG